MSTPVLLVCAAPRAYAAARMPRALARAGFDVALLAPRGALARHSGYVSRVGQLPEGATMRTWLHAFAASVRATAPRLAIPCDEIACRLLQSLLVAPPPDLHPDVQAQLATLVRDSLGDPDAYLATSDQLALPPAAARLGVRVAPHVVTASVDEAAAFADAVGYPVVVRRRHTFLGHGVASCADRGALAAAIAELGAGSGFDLGQPGDGRVLVHAAVRGAPTHYAAVAWRGALVAGWAADPLVETAAPPATATVHRFRRSPEARAAAEALARGFGMSGPFGADFVVDESGSPVLVSLQRHASALTHRGAWLDVDLCAALHAAAHDTPSRSRADLADGDARIGVAFPEEWLRDPESELLLQHPVDVPWDEPGLIEAMLALRHELWPKDRLPAAA